MITKKNRYAALFFVLFAAFSQSCGSDHSDSEYQTSEMFPDFGRIFYMSRSAGSQPVINNGQPWMATDRVVRLSGNEDAVVESSNMESSDRDYQLAVCSLRKIGLTLPASQHGVYWGSWQRERETLYGITFTWRGFRSHRISYSLINNIYSGLANTETCNSGAYSKFLVAMYHEVKGHNVDGANHDTDQEAEEFDRNYEDPVYQGLIRFRTCNVFAACMREISKSK